MDPIQVLRMKIEDAMTELSRSFNRPMRQVCAFYDPERPTISIVVTNSPDGEELKTVDAVRGIIERDLNTSQKRGT